MSELINFIKKHNLSPETKRTLSICSASAVAEAYVDILPKHGLGMSGICLVKKGPDVIFYLNVTRLKEQFENIFEKMSVKDFLKKFEDIYNKSKEELLKGNLDAYPAYFSSMGAIKAFGRYVDLSGKHMEYSEYGGKLLHTIAKLYSVIDSNLTPEQKISTVFELRNEITPKRGENYSVTYDGTWRFYNEIPEEHFEESEIIKGMGVGKGIVTGVVSHTIVDGCIYVTSMTVPYDTPKFHKIKGIVTDEGGLLSHAAVTAREFNLPCVIGTKKATKILKDGDEIEVDSNKGVVKVLKKA